jgi:16S rRNA (uracil1498-N3)-methyltransferase
MLLFYQKDLVVGEQPLGEEEAKHCLRVLRMQKGDKLYFTDGKGQLAHAVIANEQLKQARIQVTHLETHPQPPSLTHIAIAPTKNIERMEWLVEKCVEIGVHTLSFVLTQHTERSYFNMDRIEKKAVSAMKQSLKYWLPTLNAPQSFNAFLATITPQNYPQLFIAYVDKTNPTTLFKTAQPNVPTCILIGPEGDFSVEEVEKAQQKGFVKISLGESRLRTETAGLVACTTMQLIQEK